MSVGLVKTSTKINQYFFIHPFFKSSLTLQPAERNSQISSSNHSTTSNPFEFEISRFDLTWLQ